MKIRFGGFFTLLAVAALMGSTAWAQSSGNFAGQVNETQCTVSATGAGSSTVSSLSTTIKTPNSSQTALLIRPSLVTGLFTDTTLTNLVSSSTAVAAVTVAVKVDGNPVPPETSKNPSIVYDGRVQQMSDNFINLISDCTSTTSTQCSLSLVLATLSAHSFDFLDPDVGGGTHKVTVTVSLDPGESNLKGKNSGTSSSGACAGPGVLSVQQVQTFSQSGGISIQ